MANLVYNSFKMGVLLGSYKLQALPTLCCALVGSGYTPDMDAHKFRSSLTNEITGSNYNAGGFVVSSPLVTQDDTGNQGVLDASDILIANVTFNTSPRAGVLYGSTGSAAADPLFAYIDFTTDQAVTAGTFQIQWAAGGILALT